MCMQLEYRFRSLVLAHIFHRPIHYVYMDTLLQELMDTNKLEKWICPFCDQKFLSPFALSSHLFNPIKPSRCHKAMVLTIREAVKLYLEWKSLYPRYRLKRYPMETLIQFLKQKGLTR